MPLPRIATYLGIGLLFTMLFAILAVAISEVHSFDVFWQLQNGRYMVDTMSMIRTDLFTLMADVPRHEHTWLHSLILYGLYTIAGYGTISVLKGVVIATTAGCLVLAARRREASWAAITLVLPLFLLTAFGWLERPQIWTFLCSALFIWWLEVYLSKPSWRILWLLPLALFWGNVHAGSILALALVFAYLVGETGQSLIEKRFLWLVPGRLSGLLAGVLLASLANPYPALWFQTLLGSYNLGAKIDSAGKVTGSTTAVLNVDWTPTTYQNVPLFFYALGAAAVIMLLGWRRLKLSDVCLLAGLGLMGTKLVRHVPFFFMGMVAILPAYLDRIVEPLRLRLPVLYRKIALLAVFCVAAGSFWFLWQPTYKVYGVFNTGLRTWHYPIEATEFVKEHKLAKNIYNTYEWGGYMAFKLFPDYLMFWDGRQNSSEMFKLGWDVLTGKPDWEQILNKFDVNTIVIRSSSFDTGRKYSLLDRIAAHPDWYLVFNTESSMVFVKRGSVSDNWLSKYAFSKKKMDDTILSEAHLNVKYNANRYMAWWEMAKIYTRRKEYKKALFTLNQHLARSPKRYPTAVKLHGHLTRVVYGAGSK
jgi:hypothetical protein